MADRAKGFITFTENGEQISMLSDEDAGKLYKALITYQATGEETELPPMAKLMFSIMKRRLDENNEAYAEKVRRLAENKQKSRQISTDIRDDITQTSRCNTIPNTNPIPTIVGKEDDSNESSLSASSRRMVDYQGIVKEYNEVCKSLPECIKLTDSRRMAIRSRLSEYSRDDISEIFRKVEASDFLTGRETGWKGCNIDWIFKASNFLKIKEGNYDNKAGGKDEPKRDEWLGVRTTTSGLDDSMFTDFDPWNPGGET